MLPKILHYIWIGNPKTELANRCIDSFHQFMSDYQIIEWNESNIGELCLDDTEKKYYDQWYEKKKFAFCSDILRLHILNQYGGVYVDCDVEFIKHLPDEFLYLPFLGRINPQNTVCAGCIWGCNKYDSVLTKSISEFRSKLFKSGRRYGKSWIFNSFFRDMFSNDSDVLSVNNQLGYMIYPTEYFCPKNAKSGEISITDRTISIHHYALSWCDRSNNNIISSGNKL